jgi:hypothetical protein
MHMHILKTDSYPKILLKYELLVQVRKILNQHSEHVDNSAGSLSIW